MKIPLAAAALVFAAAVAARADTVIVEKVDGSGQTGQITIKVGAAKVRTDVTPQISTITDVTTGDITTLMHAQRTYMVISAATSRAMLEQMRKVMQAGGAPATPPALKPTGRTDKIDGYHAVEYTYNNGIMSGSYWFSTEFPDAAAVNAALAKFRKGGLTDMTKAFAPDPTGIPGVAVRMETLFNGQKIVTDLVSANEQPVDPTEYQVPAAYTEMKIPAQ